MTLDFSPVSSNRRLAPPVWQHHAEPDHPHAPLPMFSVITARTSRSVSSATAAHTRPYLLRHTHALGALGMPRSSVARDACARPETRAHALGLPG